MRVHKTFGITIFASHFNKSILKLEYLKYLMCIILLILSSQMSTAQSSPSPFDLLPRIEGIDTGDTTLVSAITSNPFDIIAAPARRGPSQSVGFSVEKEKKPPTPVEKEAIFKRFLFIVVIAMMVVLTLVFIIFRMLLARIWRAFLNDNMLGQLIREQSSGLTWAYRIMYVMFFLNAGLALFLSLRHFGISVAANNLTAHLLCTAGISGYFILKHFVLALISIIYPVTKEVAVYSFTIQIFNIVAGFVLVPIVLFIAYAPTEVAKLTIYIAGATLSIMFLFLIMRGLFIANRFLAWNKFHFFLYLCAVEIAPLLLIIKQL